MERDTSKLILLSGLLIGVVSAASLFWHYNQKRKKSSNSLCESRFVVSPTAVLVVSSHEEWELAYQTLHSNMSVVKVVGFDCEWVSCKTYSRPEPVDQNRKISLLQLASISGVCVLVRLHLITCIPDTLKALLADPSILKVGVASLDDSKRLSRDHGVACAGCIDLRHIALRASRTINASALGLQGLARQVLGMDLDKNTSIRRSDWEAATLSPAQIQYAALDALTAVHIFMRLIEMKFGIVVLGDSDTSLVMSRVMSICQGLTDARFSSKSSSVKDVPKSGVKGRNVSTSASRAYAVRQKPLYENCQMRSPDGQLLCTCDLKKAIWYIDKGLAVKVCDDPVTVRLLFEPNGRPADISDYYLHEKDNVCVVCGTGESYIRKNVIPREYRKHFPALFKEHKSHDVILMCVTCHQRSNICDSEMKRRLAAQCTPSCVESINGRRFLQDHTLVKVRSAAKALLSQGASRIPAERSAELEDTVKRFYGAQCMSTELLQRAVTIETEVKQSGCEEHGEVVVRYVIEHMDGGLVAFERLWRQHFLDTMRPLHMPALWSVDHCHDRLRTMETSVMSTLTNI